MPFEANVMNKTRCQWETKKPNNTIPNDVGKLEQEGRLWLIFLDSAQPSGIGLPI